METHITDQGKWERIIEVNVPYDELIPRFNEGYVAYKKKIQLEGFRKGKVPVDLIKKVFGHKIEQEIAEDSVPDFLKEAIEQNHIKMYGLSKLESFEYTREAGLKFNVVIKIRPELESPRYKELNVEKEIYQIADEDIQEAFENLREQQATMTNIEGEAQRGHYIVADVQKTNDAGIPLVGYKYENRYYHLDGDDVNQEFVEQLIGVKPGETRRVVFTANNPNTRNQEQEYYLFTVKEIKEKKLPDVDDEFARDIGNFDNLQALKDAIRQDLQRQEQENTQQNLYRQVVDEAVKNNPIELPDFMIEDYLDAFIEKVNANLQKDGKEKSIDVQEIRERYRAEAIWQLKWQMLVEKISELENIVVNDIEINQHIEELARNAGNKAAVVRGNYRDAKKREQIKYELQERKVIQLLLHHAKITERLITHHDRKRSQELII